MRELLVYILMALVLMGCEVISPDNKLIPVTPTEHGGARNQFVQFFDNAGYFTAWEGS